MFNQLWLAFKLLLSTTLVAAPITLLVVAPQALSDPVFIGISAMLLFFAALPWLNFTAPNRGLALAGIVFSLGASFLAARTALGSVQFPRQCSGRGVVYCEIENLLFAVGGEYLAAAPFALFAALLFAGSIRMLTNANRER